MRKLKRINRRGKRTITIIERYFKQIIPNVYFFLLRNFVSVFRIWSTVAQEVDYALFFLVLFSSFALRLHSFESSFIRLFSADFWLFSARCCSSRSCGSRIACSLICRSCSACSLLIPSLPCALMAALTLGSPAGFLVVEPSLQARVSGCSSPSISLAMSRIFGGDDTLYILAISSELTFWRRFCGLSSLSSSYIWGALLWFHKCSVIVCRFMLLSERQMMLEPTPFSMLSTFVIKVIN